MENHTMNFNFEYLYEKLFHGGPGKRITDGARVIVTISYDDGEMSRSEVIEIFAREKIENATLKYAMDIYSSINQYLCIYPTKITHEGVETVFEKFNIDTDRVALIGHLKRNIESVIRMT